MKVRAWYTPNTIGLSCRPDRADRVGACSASSAILILGNAEALAIKPREGGREY